MHRRPRSPSFTLGQPELAVASGDATQSVRTLAADDGERYRVVAVPAGQPGQALVLAQSLEPPGADARQARRGDAALRRRRACSPPAAAGWAVARNGLRPVRRLTDARSRRSPAPRTCDPLPVEGDDEIARLATAFNQMLTALAASRDRQRQLVADAGHELRTPLTSLRTNLDLLAQAGGDRACPTDARAELLDDVRAQIEELTTLIGDLVELARDEPLPTVVEHGRPRRRGRPGRRPGTPPRARRRLRGRRSSRGGSPATPPPSSGR